MPAYPDTPYWHQYTAPAKGILRWSDMEALWASLENSDHAWFVYDLNGDAPETPLDEATLHTAVQAARDVVNTGHDKECSGAVYVDNLANPTYIKVFDPLNMGTACGCSGVAIMPRWIISLSKPDRLPPAPPVEKLGLWARLCGSR